MVFILGKHHFSVYFFPSPRHPLCKPTNNKYNTTKQVEIPETKTLDSLLQEGYEHKLSGPFLMTTKMTRWGKG